MLMTMQQAFQRRLKPVSSLEVHSAFTGEPIQVRVYFYFSSIVVTADGATTPAEVLASVKRHPDILEEYGFQLFIIGGEATVPGQEINRMDLFDSSDCKQVKTTSSYS